MLQRLFRSRAEHGMGRRLYAAAVDQARAPELYAVLGVEDQIDARFELYTVHVVLLLERLKGQGEEAGDVGQALFDSYLSALDHALRELGVGDLSVAKKMRRLAETIYTRTHALTEALQPQAAPFALEAALAAALFPEAGDARPERLAAYIRNARDRLAAQPLREVLDGKLQWPRIAA
jgi:cytochrome b pre-mRNA-processing protein 3